MTAAHNDPRALALLLAAAVLEEIVFRLGVHEYLLRRAPEPAGDDWLSRPNLATALLFTWLHALTRGWIVALGALPAALLIGALYQRYRRLWPCVAAHATLNLAWFALAPALAPQLARWSA